MDQKLGRWLHDAGHGARAVYYYDILPKTRPIDLTAISSKFKRLQVIGPMRIKLFLRLVESGRDFINSDADAVWVRDPRTWLARHHDCDLLFSQGTIHPLKYYFKHHFVLCSGFFLCRANERTQAYFAQSDAPDWTVHDDQYRLNMLLLRDSEQRWEIRKPEVWMIRKNNCSRVYGRGCNAVIRNGSRTSRAWHTTLAPLRLTADPVLKYIQNCILSGLGTYYIVTSRDLMRGQSCDGLSVGVIPMSLVWRSVGEPADDMLVRHPYAERLGI